VRETFGLGRILGIRVGINWSLLVVAALVAAGLSADRFPIEAPGYTDVAYGVAGVAAAVLFFASVLAHELSHALVGRREGLEVESITLWLLGGVTRIDGEARSPAGEVRVSGAGPLVSLLLGGLLTGTGFAIDATGAARLVAVSALWLGFINLVLGLFNILPGAPLDGGRLVHAFVWWRTGDRMRATRSASRLGRILGSLLVVAGIAEFAFDVGTGGGLWLALVGWFLVSSARAEENQAEVRHALDGVRLADLMTPDPVVGPGWYTIQAFLDDVVMSHRHSAFPVERWGGGLAGLVTLNQLRGVPTELRPATRVLDVACPLEEVATAGPADLVVDVLAQTPGCAQGRILVMDGGQLVGIVSPSDVVAALRRAGLRAS
jgi:Zn-dependent protease